MCAPTDIVCASFPGLGIGEVSDLFEPLAKGHCNIVEIHHTVGCEIIQTIGIVPAEPAIDFRCRSRV